MAWPDPHRVGTLVINLLGLEHVLRLFLYDLAGTYMYAPIDGVPLYDTPVGTLVEESALTDYRTLGQLIAAFNAEMQRRKKPPLDHAIVGLRDLIAHGRMSSGYEHEPQRLVKYTKPDRTTRAIRVEARAVLTDAWLDEQVALVAEAAQHVATQLEPSVS